MEDLGLVSIITPSYNSSQYICETIEGIINQTYENWELLITDDCSNDNTVEIIEKYVSADNRVKLYRLDRNSGAGICRNNSIEKANGRFIAFCDSDDVWMPKKLEMQLRFMQKNDCALTYSSYMTMDEKSNVNGIVVCMNRISFASMKRDDGIGCLTAIYDTDKVGKMYMSSLRKRQDWGLWLEILKKCRVAYGIKEPLAYYRIRANSISNKKISLVKHNINVYRKILHFSLIKSYLYFLFIFMPTYTIKKIKIKINNM